MKQSQARREGLRFTGHYENYSNFKMKKRAAEIRLRHKCRAVVVETGDHGYSVYADEKYFIQERIEDFKNKLKAIPQKKQSLQVKYNSELVQIEKNQKEMEEYIKEHSS